MAKVARIWIQPGDYKFRVIGKDKPQWSWTGRSSNYKDVSKGGPFKSQKECIKSAEQAHPEAEIVVVVKKPHDYSDPRNGLPIK